jgi:aerobic carbon-monoxide dehydrogenase medium subunit
MKPAPFVYQRPGTVAEVVDVLGQQADEAKILAGGQSLVPLMNLRLAAPGVLVDINWVEGLDRVETTAAGLVIGASARQADVEASAEVRAACPLLVEALRYVAHPQLRNRGTVVGSLAHHDPAAELPAVAVAMDAELSLVGPGGERTVPAAEFFTGFFTTAAEPDELVTVVRFPTSGSSVGVGFHELARRPGDFAMVAAAATLRLDDGNVSAASIALAGAADRPVRCSEAERQLVGQPAGHATWQEAGVAAAAEGAIAPMDDVHTSAGYRRAMIPVVVAAALAQASANAT